MSNGKKLLIVIGIVLVIGGVIAAFAWMGVQDDLFENEPIQKQEPILEIKQDTVILALGDYFDANQYITKATDWYGNDIRDKVSVMEDLSTESPGEYRVVYTLVIDEKAVEEKVLHVIVSDAGQTND